MKRKTSDIFIRIAAICIFIVGFLAAIGVVIGMMVFSFTMKNLNSSKLLMVDFVAFIVALIVFLSFFGIYEFLISFIKVEKDIEQIEEEVANDGAEWRKTHE